MKPGYQNKGLNLAGKAAPKAPPKPAHLTPGYNNVGPGKTAFKPGVRPAAGPAKPGMVGNRPSSQVAPASSNSGRPVPPAKPTAPKPLFKKP